MSQLATVLPTNNLTSASGGQTWSTTIYPGSTGLETRNRNWLNPRQTWTLNYVGYASELQPLFDLFAAAKGIWQSFKFTPPGSDIERDFRFDTDVLTIEVQPGQVSDILTISFTVIEVLDE